MMAVLKRAWLSLLLLGAALLLLVMTFGLNPTARLVPMAVAVPTIVLLLLQSCLDLFPRLSGAVARFDRLRLRRVETLRARGSASKPPEEEALGPVLLWFVAAPALVYLLGFALAAPLYTTALVRFRAEESWPRSLVTGLAVALVILLLLTLAFGESAIDGILTDWALGD